MEMESRQSAQEEFASIIKPKHQEKIKKHGFEKQMEQLFKRGNVNVKLNIKALKKSNGDLESSIAYLNKKSLKEGHQASSQDKSS